jgi:hypothetical protein
MEKKYMVWIDKGKHKYYDWRIVMANNKEDAINKTWYGYGGFEFIYNHFIPKLRKSHLTAKLLTEQYQEKIRQKIYSYKTNLGSYDQALVVMKMK